MNLTQNDRLKQVTSETLIVGVDVGSQTHFCRAFDWRAEHLIGEGLNFPEEYLSLAIPEWDSLHFFVGQRNS